MFNIIEKVYRGKLFRIILCIGCSVVLAACALNKPKEKSYRVIHEPALHSEMRSMGNSLGVIVTHYYENKLNDSELHDIVSTELTNIESIAASLGGEDTITNYSVISRYMGAFLYDVRLAREFAERDPPNFLPAFRLVHSCQSCHESM